MDRIMLAIQLVNFFRRYQNVMVEFIYILDSNVVKQTIVAALIITVVLKIFYTREVPVFTALFSGVFLFLTLLPYPSEHSIIAYYLFHPFLINCSQLCRCTGRTTQNLFHFLCSIERFKL